MYQQSTLTKTAVITDSEDTLISPLAPMSDPKNIEIRLQPPPGSIVAPNGFPADPRPSKAPQYFRDAMSIRIEVFCDEQKCAIEPELDEDDPRSWSWIAYMNSSDSLTSEPVSTIRMVPPPHAPHPNGFHDPDEKPYVKLTRVATLKHARGKGLSKLLILQAFKDLSRLRDEIGHGWDGLILTHSQVTVEPVYAKLGFVTDDKLGRWDEEGIEHLGMWKNLDLDNCP